MKATFRLMQESGVSGPMKTTTEPETPLHAQELAGLWSMGQTGHPWDVWVVEIPEPEMTIELRPDGDEKWGAEEWGIDQ